MNTQEFAEQEGRRAFEIGLERNMNPYDWETDKEFFSWDKGYMEQRTRERNLSGSYSG